MSIATKSFTAPKSKVVRCPVCEYKLCDILAGSKPFELHSIPMVISLTCGKCGDITKLEVVNAKN